MARSSGVICDPTRALNAVTEPRPVRLADEILRLENVLFVPCSGCSSPACVTVSVTIESEQDDQDATGHEWIIAAYLA
jgi:hypothetical protein